MNRRNVYFLLFAALSVVFPALADAAPPRTSQTRALRKQPDGSGAVVIAGERKQWHKVTLTLDGPFACEQDNDPNPFTDYRMTVTFTHESGAPAYAVPGYFAADGNAAETSATAGTTWRAHLSPDKPGQWTYAVSFLKGQHVAVRDVKGEALKPFDGQTGTFTVGPTDKTGSDFRAKGRLHYVGKHHLQFAGTKEYFLKAGADAPETLLGYADFDGTEARKKPVPLKTWRPHVRDWREGDPTWKNGKGKGLIGALNYLSGKGCNAFSFLPYNAGGDGDNVWPFIARDDKVHYDCSKLDQWQIVFDHATARGLYLHVKMQETENDDLKGPGAAQSLDGGDLGLERKLYCRELIARFGHALALNWNLGEENTQSAEQQRAMARFIHDLDPYRHLIVIHTYPNKQDAIYPELLGDRSVLAGASLQNPWNQVHQCTLKWVTESEKAGKPWVVANDEQNGADSGVPPDLGYAGYTGKKKDGKPVQTADDIRHATLWGNLMAGGAGVEYYFGYQLPQSDLVCEDFRSRDKSWDYCRIALACFHDNRIPFWEMTNADALIGNATNDNSKYCLAKPGACYLVYLPKGGTTELDLTGVTGTFTVKWFNPRTGGPLENGSVKSVSGGGRVSLGAPPAAPGQDWAVLLQLSLTGFTAEKKGPLTVNHDLTKTIDFERVGTYHLGATGAHGWLFVRKQKTAEARQILITEVEAGSPADGILQDGDVILGIAGRRFDADARKQFGMALDEAEKKENKGILKLTRWRPVKDAQPRRGVEEEVEIKLQAQEPFSDTAPYNCARSLQLMEAALSRILADAAKKNFGRIDESLLALMAVGRPEHIKLVKDYLHQAAWAKPDYKISLESGGLVCWAYGLHGLIMTEYYLATGDDYVLPAIKEHAVKIAMGQSGGGLWGHGFAWASINEGKLHGRLNGYGALNLAGLPCLLTLVMAEKCGVSHPEIDAALQRALPFFADFVGRGTIGYGYHCPSLDHNNSGRNGQASNGKNAIAGLIFTALGDRKVSQYYASQVASSYDEHEHGHAGNSFTRFWDMLGVNCGGPEVAAAYHKELRWYNALCRGWDGRILFQQLGGSYGGPTMNLDAACVLANALPLRKLYITGKRADQKLWLTDDQVKAAIAAGRWHWADCDALSAEQLIAALDCWSPGAREWIAEALGRKSENLVPQLIKAFEGKSADMRAGVCTALGYQGERAAPAVPLLVKALEDEASTVRVAAAYGLMRTGKPGRKAIPDMLKAVVNQEKESPLEPVLQALSYSLGADAPGTAPLYFIGIFPSTPEGENPLDGIDRRILYPAMARMISARSARIRDCGSYALRYFNRDDVKNMVQEIYDLAKCRAPDFGMFADRACGRGMDELARFQVSDGVKVCVDALLEPRWGSYWREPHHFLTLQRYGKTASSELPRLKAARASRPSGEKREILDETIKVIEGDTSDLKPVSVQELMAEQ